MTILWFSKLKSTSVGVSKRRFYLPNPFPARSCAKIHVEGSLARNSVPTGASDAQNTNTHGPHCCHRFNQIAPLLGASAIQNGTTSTQLKC